MRSDEARFGFILQQCPEMADQGSYQVDVGEGGGFETSKRENISEDPQDQIQANTSDGKRVFKPYGKVRLPWSHSCADGHRL